MPTKTNIEWTDYVLKKLVITVPLPPKATHPNARPSRRALFAAKKQQRSDAHFAAVAAVNDLNTSPPRWLAAKLHAEFHKPGSRSKQADADGLVAWLKATLDGLQDAGIIANDAGFMIMSPTQRIGEHATERKVVLTITPILERL